MKQCFKMLAIVAVVLPLMAFSCSKKKTIGSPYILFEVHGTVYGDHVEIDPVTSEEIIVTSPLKGIRISSGNVDPVYTNKNGDFTFYGRSAPDDEAVLVFVDDDGSTNYGPYQKLSQTVRLVQRDGGDDRNYMGYWYASGVEVKMLLKNESINPDPTLP